MDRFKKQSIELMLDMIDQQLKSIRIMLAMSINEKAKVLPSPEENPTRTYTNDAEDAEIERLISDGVSGGPKHEYLDEIFEKASVSDE